MTAVPPAPTLAPAGGDPALAANLIDWPRLRANYPGREAFVIRLATIALDSQQEVPEKLRAALGEGALEAVAFMAHSLKGVGGNLMAPGVQDLAARTERAAKTGQPDAASLAAELADQVGALLVELRARIRENGGPSSA